MCLPAAMMGASGLLSVVGAVTNIIGQTQQYNTQKDFTNKQVAANKAHMQENRDLATKAYLDQATATNAQLSEQREVTAAANFDKSREAAQRRGEVLVAAAESGVAGNSLNTLLNEFHRQEGMFLQRNNQNLLFREQQTSRQVEGFRTEAVNRTNAIKPFIPSPVNRPDYLSPLLQVGNSTLGTAVAGGVFKKGG